MVDVYNPTLRTPTVDKIPSVTRNGVSITQTTHELTYVPGVNFIGPTPTSTQVVDAWELNNGIISAKAILKGGNLVSIKLYGEEYVWINNEGATYYGAKSGGNESPFPLTRGLILHGGIRLAAVTAEHGLYYDTPWDISFETDSTSSSIILSIKDDKATRDSVNDPFTSASYSLPGDPTPLSKYPVTNAIFRFKITLVNGESFVRLHSELEKTTDGPIHAEIWLPQTYQITTESQIISPQVKRRVKDVWVRDVLFPHLAADIIPLSNDPDRILKPYQDLLTEPNSTPFIDQRVLTKFPPTGYELEYPLKWQSASGGILYDYPYRDGNYHAVSFGDTKGRGVAAVGSSTTNHFTKLWSWGNPALFDRKEILKEAAAGNFGASLASGRPFAEYYEPWDTAFNTGFFERHKFTNLINGWDTFIVPIESGLDNGKSKAELRQVVEKAISPAVTQINITPSIPEVLKYLQWALETELGTIPPYLTALWSIKKGINSITAVKYSTTIRSIVIQEMLHLALVANVISSLGGTPDLSPEKVIKPYPRGLPHQDSNVLNFIDIHLAPASPELIKYTFLKIELPAKSTAPPQKDNWDTLGQFYEFLQDTLSQLPESSFSDRNQVTKIYDTDKHPGGGLFKVTNKELAAKALQEIIDQGEGRNGGRFEDKEKDVLAHFYAFEDLLNVPFDPNAIYPAIIDPPSVNSTLGKELYKDDITRSYSLLFDGAYSLLLRTLNKILKGDIKDNSPEFTTISNNFFTLMIIILPQIAEDLYTIGPIGPSFSYSNEDSSALTYRAVQLERAPGIKGKNINSIVAAFTSIRDSEVKHRINYYERYHLSADFSRGTVSPEKLAFLVDEAKRFIALKVDPLPPDVIIDDATAEKENIEWFPTHCACFRSGRGDLLNLEYTNDLFYACADGPFTGVASALEIEKRWGRILATPNVTMYWPIVNFKGPLVHIEWICLDNYTGEIIAKGFITKARKGHKGACHFKSEQLTFYRDV